MLNEWHHHGILFFLLSCQTNGMLVVVHLEKLSVSVWVKEREKERALHASAALFFILCPFVYPPYLLLSLSSSVHLSTSLDSFWFTLSLTTSHVIITLPLSLCSPIQYAEDTQVLHGQVDCTGKVAEWFFHFKKNVKNVKNYFHYFFFVLFRMYRVKWGGRVGAK